MTPAFIEKNLDKINNSEYCIIDTNLPEDTINYICKKITSPLVVKTVSLNKNYRLIHNFMKIEILITTKNELSHLLSQLNETYTSLNQAVDFLLSKGVKNIIVFSTDSGLFFKNYNNKYHLKANHPSVVNTNGASATLTGTLIWALQNNMKWEDALKYAYAAAISTMETQETVNQNLSQEFLLEKKQLLFKN